MIVTSKRPSKEPTSPIWRINPAFRVPSMDSTIALQVHRGPDTNILTEDHAGMFTLRSHTSFTYT